MDPSPFPRVRKERSVTIRVEADPGEHRIELEGELDLSGCPALAEEIHRAESSGARVLVIDLSELRFIDSRGIAQLVHAVRRFRESETELRFIHGPRAVERVFQIAGLSDFLPFDEGDGYSPRR